MATATLTILTPDDLLTMPEGNRYELVGGRLVEKKMSMESVWVAGRLYRKIDEFGGDNGLGLAFTDGAGYRCFPFDPDLVRKPDVSFIKRGRLTPDQFSEGHCRIHPDLSVEVVSPTNLYSEVEQRVHDFLEAGTSLVWVVSPENRFNRIHRRDGTVAELKETAELTGEDVLPGFRCRVSDLFPPRDPGQIL